MLTSLTWSVYRYIELYLELLCEFSSLTPYVYMSNPPYSILSHPDKHTPLHSNIHKLCPYHLGYIVLIYPWRSIHHTSSYTRIQDSSCFRHHSIPGYRTYPVSGIILYQDTGLILFETSFYTRIQVSSCLRHHSIPGYRTHPVSVIILFRDTGHILFEI